LKGGPPFEKSVAIELIVKPSTRNAMAAGIDLISALMYDFKETQGRVEFVSKLLKRSAKVSAIQKRWPDAILPLIA